MASRVLHPLLVLLASVTWQELARQVAYLNEENRILRGRLPRQIRTTETERKRLIRAGRKLGTQLKELITIVSYETFRRWVREQEQQRGDGTKAANFRRAGRPRTPEEVRELVLRVREETGYGYTKLRQELRKLGVKLSRQTVKNILVEAGFGPDGPEGSDTWDAFLKRHADTLWQCDYISKPMWTVKGLVDLYLIVFIHLGTRRIWVSPCTAHPHAAWAAQQARNFLMHSKDVGLGPKYVVHDRDTKFTTEFDEILKSTDCKIKKITIQSPNLQAHVERVVQTLKHEVLNHFLVVSERHLNYICRQAQDSYNNQRGHSARDDLPPAWEHDPEEVKTVKLRDVVCTTRLGGLLKSYSRRAA